MSKPLFKPPKHLVSEWPEVFEDLYMNTMPVYYVEIIRLELKHGQLWEINVSEQLENSHPDIIAEKLIETFHEYKNDIVKIDFKININKLKEDILNQTKGFFS